MIIIIITAIMCSRKAEQAFQIEKYDVNASN